MIAVPAMGETWEGAEDAIGCVGFCVVLDGETQITQLATRASTRRRGLGARTTRTMIGLRPHNAIVLEVKSRNLPARALYETCGFVEVGRRKRYYADGDDAVCMTRRPPSERAVSTRELTRLLAGLDPDAARKPAPAVAPESNAPSTASRSVDAPRAEPFARGAGAFKMRARARRPDA